MQQAPANEAPSRAASEQVARHSLPSVYLRGLAMGAADIVPGVSGGTVAIILGVYRRLIEAVRALPRPRVLGPLLRGRFREAWAAADFGFLLVLAAGILTSVLTLSGLLERALQAWPALVFAFFFGLVLASVLIVGRDVRRRTPGRWAFFLLAAALMYLFMGVTPASTPDDAWFLFLAGSLAVSALLLPGVSGAFVLIILGKYEFALAAVASFDLLALAPLVGGMLVGLLSFAQVLGWLFRNYHDTTLAILSGILLGSLRRLWPWQGESQERLEFLPPPADLLALEDGLLWVTLLVLLGLALVLGLDAAERRREEAA